MKYLILAIAAIMLFSCNSTAKKIQKAREVLNANPPAGAQYCADNFLVKTVTDTKSYDSSIAVIDSLINTIQHRDNITEAERDDLLNVIDQLRNNRPDCDSVSKPINELASRERRRGDDLQRLVDQLKTAAKNVKPIRDTIENTARVEACRITLSQANDKILAQSKEIDDLKAFKASMRGKIHISWYWVVIACIALLGWAYYRIKAGALKSLINKLK